MAVDPGIRRYVLILRAHNIATFESCEPGDGHCSPEPTVAFHGDYAEGFRALGVALRHRLPVVDLRRVWSVTDGEPTGPHWAMGLLYLGTT
jgi:hypothetical protein